MRCKNLYQCRPAIWELGVQVLLICAWEEKDFDLKLQEPETDLTKAPLRRIAFTIIIDSVGTTTHTDR
ncbi:hypothetical protein EJB05_38729, partial [Eragrostis curvula]